MKTAPRVLIADDSPTVRASLGGVLSLAGFEVHEATNARGALEKARAIGPAVIVTDLRMAGARDPGSVRGGEELLRKLKADPELRQIQVLVVTGEDGQRSAALLRRLGAAKYFSKPYDPEAIIAAIREVI